MKLVITFCKFISNSIQISILTFSAVLVVVSILLVQAIALDLKCQIVDEGWGSLEGFECKAVAWSITGQSEIVTSINGKTEALNDVVVLSIEDQTLNYFPRNLEKFFPNLKGIKVLNTGLKSVKQENLKPFPKLSHLALFGGDLEKLDNDLFEFNPELKWLALDDNKLNFIGDNLFSHLEKLKKVSLYNNRCINKKAWKRDDIEDLVDVIRTNCQRG